MALCVGWTPGTSNEDAREACHETGSSYRLRMAGYSTSESDALSDATEAEAIEAFRCAVRRLTARRPHA